MEVLIRKGLQGVGLLLLGVVLTILLLWAWLLLSSNVFNHPLTKGAWPIVCSSRQIGCITASNWHNHYRSRLVFASATESEEPDPVVALTSLVRQRLVSNSFLQVPISVKDAARYRENVLRMTDEKVVKKTTGLSFKEYDELVILPLLKQEALRQQENFDSLSDLFISLASNSSIYVLPRGLTWDKEKAEVVKH